MKSYTFLFVCCIGSLLVNAQLSGEKQYLKVGDKVPSFKLTNLINYPSRAANISDFKGKLLILDFWSTGCTSCIESWPKLETLKKQFADKIQIILINAWQDEDIVRSLIEKRKKAAIVELTLPSVCKDTSILKLFAVSGLPHIVWINEDGKLISITGGGALTGENISAILKGKKVNMVQKINNDEYYDVDYKKPLFIGGNGGTGVNIKWQSLFSTNEDFVRPATGLMNNSEVSKIIAVGPLIDLYRFAYSNRLDMHERNLTRLQLNRIILNMKDTAKYLSRIDGQERPENRYIYELTAGKPVSTADLQSMMQEDLKRYIGLEVRWESRKINCLVLASSDTTLSSYKIGDFIFQVSDAELKLNKVSVRYLIKWLEDVTPYYYSPFPIIDETGIRGLLGSIEIEGNVYNYKVLNELLSKYGLSFTLQEREVKFLVLSEPVNFKFLY